MIFAVDVSYQDQSAFVVAVLFKAWDSSSFEMVYTKTLDSGADYASGAFYKRELPCILAILSEIKQPIDLIVIDGYVVLGEQHHAGLGMHLYHALEGKIPIIGVAKNHYLGTPVECEILRGTSTKPLYITSVGVDLALAKLWVSTMHGEHRIPTLLKQLDQKTKQK